MKEIAVLLVEDDADFRCLLAQRIAEQPDMRLAGAYGEADAACEAARSTQPDIVLMDLSLGTGEMDGVLAARRLRLETRVKVIILTVHEDPDTVMWASTEGFASAYVAKSQSALLLPTIRATAAGPTPQSSMIFHALSNRLTAAERAVFRSMLGFPVSLRSAGKTIANQQTNVLRKLKLENKRQLRQVFSAYLSPLSGPEGDRTHSEI